MISTVRAYKVQWIWSSTPLNVTAKWQLNDFVLHHQRVKASVLTMTSRAARRASVTTIPAHFAESYLTSIIATYIPMISNCFIDFSNAFV
jgi:hypothetical protein